MYIFCVYIIRYSMLLFGDLHINSRICDRVIETMKNWISQNSDEKDLIFLWDYVYHFSYDREALLKLYSFFLELYQEWKNVYILAWNHDWLGNTFVFEEAKRTYEIIKNVFDNWESSGKIEFITEPKVENIDWEDILFLPYCLEIDGWSLSWLMSKGYKIDSSVAFLSQNDNEVSSWAVSEGYNLDFSLSSEWQVWWAQLIEIESTVNTLSKSQNKNEKFSAELNKLLLKYYQKYGKLTVIHHYYTEWVNFPWQRWRFYFNDIALSHLFCELDWMKLISGHLHQWFAYKNYFCTWSVRNTSPLEVNQAKMLFKYLDWKMSGKMFFVNPYFQVKNIAEWVKIDDNFLENFKKEVIQENIKNYENQWRDVEINSDYDMKNKDISVSLSVWNMNYEDMYSYIDEDLFKQLRDVKLKKVYEQTDDLFEKMDIEWKNLTSWFADWKGLLKDYLKVKYPNEYEKYLDFLKKENILK